MGSNPGSLESPQAPRGAQEGGTAAGRQDWGSEAACRLSPSERSPGPLGGSGGRAGPGLPLGSRAVGEPGLTRVSVPGLGAGG